MKKYYFIIFIILLFLPLATEGAILYLEPSAGQYHQEDTFIVEARIDSQGEYINAVEANLNFSSEVLEVKDLSRGNSILTLWVKEPSFSNNIISFIGGMPAGYQGADGMIGKIIFKLKVKSQKSKITEVKFTDDSKVLLNDGKGTEADLITKSAKFNILVKKAIPEDEWQKEIEKDKISPQPFKVEIAQDPAIFKGKYFITFSTTDKETGIAHYEVREGKRDWKMAISPYVLENQKLFDDIWIKAVDKAGNEWIEIIEAPRRPIWKCILDGILALIGLLVIIRLGLLIIQRIITKKQ